ncbi:MAG: hypothetical protein HDR29_04950 [Lachnospiraceae bacterium]|nr:hypothetical protein [Lachnospiraceae bacterium]
MRKHLKFAGKCVVFVCILCICVAALYRIMLPKGFVNGTWPNTSTHVGFYEMEENTIDVLFLGSSSTVTSFIPQELYNNYGITSYNLGCTQQNMVSSYFWLREVLEYQRPKALVLDCFFMFLYDASEPNNLKESAIREALNYMRWSPVKQEAIKTICELDDRQSPLDYYFINNRYHTRWTNLEEKDFLFADMSRHNELKGYSPIAKYCGYNYVPFEAETAEDAEESADLVPLMEEYLDKIVELCKQEGIELILTAAPNVEENIGRYKVIQKYADGHNLLFLDFNEKELYEKIDFQFKVDHADRHHSNLWGAQKVTNYIGEILKEQYGVEARDDEQWENTKAYYEQVQKDCELAHIENIDEYLTQVHDDRYSIFISTKGLYASHLKDSTAQKLKELGLMDLKGEKRYCYYAVISDGKIEEQIAYEPISHSGTISNNRLTYDITGAGSIIIDEEEQSQDGGGFNFVVYNNDTMKLIDSVCFNTCEEENGAVRQK